MTTLLPLDNPYHFSSMLKGPQGQKRPVIGNAVHVMQIATGETISN